MDKNILKTIPHTQSIRIHLFETIWADRYHVNTSNEILHVLNGNFTLTFADGRKFPGSPGDTLFVPAGTSHMDFFEPDEELEIFMISFAWDDAPAFFEKVSSDAAKSASEQVRSELAFIFDAIRSDSGAADIDRAVTDCRLLHALALIYRDVATGTSAKKDSESELAAVKRRRNLASAAKRYLERHFRENLRLEDLAEELKVSSFHLSRIFSSESEFSLFEYLTELRMNEAKKLLRDGRHTVSDVAQMVGYDNGNYFAKVFRKRIGIPPSHFR